MFKKQVKCFNCGFLSVVGAEDVFEPSGKDPVAQLQLFRELGLIGMLELKQAGREEIAKGTLSPRLLACARNIWSKYDLRGQSKPNAFKVLTLERKCLYFFPYNPGYTPKEHLELQREREQRRFLIIVSVISAAVGAAIATLANVVWSLPTN